MIRLGWADIKTSSPQPRSVRFVEFARTDSASQFDRFLQPCLTTSRPRDIPAGNIRQRQTDLSPHTSLSKSLRGCEVVVSEVLSQADHDTLICLVGRHLDADLGKHVCASASTTASEGRLNKTSLRVAVSESHLPTNHFPRKIPYREYRAEKRDLLGRDAMFG